MAYEPVAESEPGLVAVGSAVDHLHQFHVGRLELAMEVWIDE